MGRIATPTVPPGSSQRRLVVALVVVVVVLLVALAWVAGMLVARKQGGSSAVVPPASSPSPQASAGAGTAPAGATPPATADISGAGSLLGPGPGADPSQGRGNAGTCQAWVDTGWTGSCGLVPVNGTASSDQAVAFVTEHKAGGSGVQWRAFVMTTTASEAFWHTRLYYSDEMGGGFTNVTIKAVDTTGGGRPDLLVGFRHNKTSGSGTVLDYDVIQRNSPSAPLAIVMHRQLADGSVVIAGGHVNDYESGPSGQYARSDITFSGGLFHLAATTQVPASAVPASLLP